MAKPVRMHVARTPSKYVDKAGKVHRYESILVRRTFRDAGYTQAELMSCPGTMEALEALSLMVRLVEGG